MQQCPYDEVIRDAEDLLRRATQMGALRGIAFATALIGEAALLMGDLTRAERELAEAVDLHRDIDAPAGEALSLQRLAEVRLAQGDRSGSQRLLERALPLARWSVIGSHLPAALAELAHVIAGPAVGNPAAVR
jgi:ATP/maltotriose-dependent transcriptional regulator MalT